jgi:hypothetical protein
MPNYDEKTGIHYGVISPNSISSETLSDLQDKSIDTIYEESKKEFLASLRAVLNDSPISSNESDVILDECADRFSEAYENDYHGYEYEDKEYVLKICDDNFGIFVIKSPYYTYTRQCSPCAPGAGDLNAPISKAEYDKGKHDTFMMYGTVKAYCLDKSFFDPEYHKIHYRYYRVCDDTEVIDPIVECD